MSVAVLMISGIATEGTDRFATTTGAGSRSGADWANAYSNLQAAVDASGTGDALYLMYGDYVRTNAILITGKPLLRIIGGMAGTAPEPGPPTAQPSAISRNPSFFTRLVQISSSTVTMERVVIQGGFLNTDGEYGAGIRMSAGSSLTLTNCTVQNNRIQHTGFMEEGGGIYCSGGRLQIDDCRFLTNQLLFGSWPTYGHGGGVFLQNADFTVRGTLFAGNTTYTRHYEAFGSGLYCVGGSGLVESCAFSNNLAYTEGGGSPGSAFGAGIYAANVQSLQLTDLVFVGNQAYGGSMGPRQGDALRVSGSTVTVTRVAVVGNGATGQGDGAVYVASGKVFCENLLVAGNRAGDGLRNNGGTVRINSGTFVSNYLYGVRTVSGSTSASNCIAWFNNSGGFYGSSVRYSCSQELIEDIGNVVTNPLFADRKHWHLASVAGQYTNGFFNGGTWRQGTTNSPLIDTGYPQAAWTNEPDPNGFLRNMGAYGNTITASKTYLESPGVFTTLTVYAHTPVSVGLTNAVLRGQVLDTGGGPNPRVYFCWGTADGGFATGGWTHVINMGTGWGKWGVFTSSVSPLSGGQTYRYRVFGTNTTGSDWSGVLQTFRTTSAAAVTNTGAYKFTRNAATLRGAVADSGGDDPLVWFYYWRGGDSVTTTVAMGEQSVTWPFSVRVAGLWTNTQYFYRIMSSNVVGTSWSQIRDFSTLGTNPVSRYLTTSGAGLKDGTTWANAYGSIEDALSDCVFPGDTIYMKYGTYQRQSEVVVSNMPGLIIRGSMAGTAPEPGPIETNEPTRLTRNGLYLTRLMHLYQCTITFDRVTFDGGYLAASGADGAGIYAQNNTALTMTNCAVQNNQCFTDGVQEGAGLYQSGGRLRIYNCSFLTNTLPKSSWSTYSRGGGIAAVNSDTVIRNTLFRGCRVYARHYDTFGGALYIAGGSGTAEACEFTNNSAEVEDNGSGWGGAVHISGSQFLVTDSFFAGNYVTGAGNTSKRGTAVYLSGGGLWRSVLDGNGHAANALGVVCLAGSAGASNCLVVRSVAESGIATVSGSPRIEHCTVANLAGWGITNASGSTPVIRNCIAWGNGMGGIGVNGTVTYSCSQGSLPGEGTIVADPLFADTTYYHLKSRNRYYAGGYFTGGTWVRADANSPCIDAGDPAGSDANEPRPSGRANMGCYGNTTAADITFITASILIVR